LLHPPSFPSYSLFFTRPSFSEITNGKGIGEESMVNGRPRRLVSFFFFFFLFPSSPLPSLSRRTMPAHQVRRNVKEKRRVTGQDRPGLLPPLFFPFSLLFFPVEYPLSSGAVGRIINDKIPALRSTFSFSFFSLPFFLSLQPHPFPGRRINKKRAFPLLPSPFLYPPPSLLFPLSVLLAFFRRTIQERNLKVEGNS